MQMNLQLNFPSKVVERLARKRRHALLLSGLFFLVSGTACSEVAVSEVNSASARAQTEKKIEALSSAKFRAQFKSVTQNFAEPLRFDSPDRGLSLRFELGRMKALKQVPLFSVKNAQTGKEILNSTLGLKFSELDLTSGLTLEAATESLVRDSFPLPMGRASQVNEAYREIRLTLLPKMNPVYRLLVTLRIYNEAVAVRSEVMEVASSRTKTNSQSFSKLSLLKEEFSLRFGADAVLTALPLPFGSAYEAHYQSTPWAKIPLSQTWGLPALVQTRSQTVMVTEADLHNYANAYLVAETADGKISGAEKTLGLTMPPRTESALGVLVEQAISPRENFTTPWRVLWIGAAGEAGLHVPLESNLLASLNRPADAGDWSWVKPGKILFQWWNGYTTRGQVFNPPADVMQASTLKKHIDFCAEHGIPYFSLDGYEFDRAWYGGQCSSFDPKTQDLLKPLPAVQMPEVLAYAKSRGVKARFWLHGDGLHLENLDQVLSTYEAWGGDGIMVDFMGDDTQTGIVKNEEILKSAARHHLVVGFHGIAKPTGLTRTYPNLLSEEGVMGQEYNKWEGPHSTPDHEVEVGLIRGAVGPMDTHQGSFRPVPMKQFKPHTLQPNSMGTLAHQLSTYIVYENEQSMLADYPEAYLKHAAELAFVSQIPVVWDETRVLRADLAQHVLIIARRAGDVWYVGVMLGDQGRKVQIPLGFLKSGEHHALIFQDVPESSKNGELILKREAQVTPQDLLGLALANGGGAVLRIDAN